MPTPSNSDRCQPDECPGGEGPPKEEGRSVATAAPVVTQMEE